MTDLDKQIEYNIEVYALILSDLKEGFDRDEEEYYQYNKVRIYDTVKQVVKSTVAKEYWQQEMYSEEEVLELLKKCLFYTGIDSSEEEFNDWWKQNKKK